MDIRRALTILAGLLAAVATAIAFRLFPVDLTSPVSWLWIPLFGGAVFINTFGFAAIVLLVPCEIITHYLPGQNRLEVIEARDAGLSGEIATAGPTLACERVA